MTAVPGVAFLAGAGVGQSALHVPPTLIPAHSWNQITSLLEGNPLVMGGHATPMHLLTYLIIYPAIKIPNIWWLEELWVFLTKISRLRE